MTMKMSEQPDHTSRLAWVDGSAEISMIDFIETRDEIDIVDVFTDPKERRQGYATQLLKELMKKGKDLSLEVRPKNEAALKVYTRLGFKPAGERKAYYKDGSDALVMRWTA